MEYRLFYKYLVESFKKSCKKKIKFELNLLEADTHLEQLDSDESEEELEGQQWPQWQCCRWF